MLLNLDHNPKSPDPKDPSMLNMTLGSYASIEAPPSRKLPYKYCDFTGLPAKYKSKIPINIAPLNTG